MGKQTYVVEGIGKTKKVFAWYGKNVFGKMCPCKDIDNQNGKTQKGKGQSYRGVIAYTHTVNNTGNAAGL